MSDSATTLPILSSNQAQKEVTANALFKAGYHSLLGGFDESRSSALSWKYLGGKIMVDGTVTTVADGTIALTASQTNYIEINRAGTVSKNTSGFTAGSIPWYAVVAGAAAITSYTDYRVGDWPIDGHLLKSLGSDANYTLTAVEARCQCLEISSGGLTATRDIVLPVVKGSGPATLAGERTS